MIILNPRIKQRGKRHASTDFYLSTAYSDSTRIAFMIDGNLRMITFPISFNLFCRSLVFTNVNSVEHFDRISIRKSLTKTRITFPDSTIVYFNSSTMQNFIK